MATSEVPEGGIRPSRRTRGGEPLFVVTRQALEALALGRRSSDPGRRLELCRGVLRALQGTQVPRARKFGNDPGKGD